jgi:hypothetical protein
VPSHAEPARPGDAAARRSALEVISFVYPSPERKRILALCSIRAGLPPGFLGGFTLAHLDHGRLYTTVRRSLRAKGADPSGATIGLETGGPLGWQDLALTQANLIAVVKLTAESAEQVAAAHRRSISVIIRAGTGQLLVASGSGTKDNAAAGNGAKHDRAAGRGAKTDETAGRGAEDDETARRAGQHTSTPVVVLARPAATPAAATPDAASQAIHATVQRAPPSSAGNDKGTRPHIRLPILGVPFKGTSSPYPNDGRRVTLEAILRMLSDGTSEHDATTDDAPPEMTLPVHIPKDSQGWGTLVCVSTCLGLVALLRLAVLDGSAAGGGTGSCDYFYGDVGRVMRVPDGGSTVLIVPDVDLDRSVSYARSYFKQDTEIIAGGRRTRRHFVVAKTLAELEDQLHGADEDHPEPHTLVIVSDSKTTVVKADETHIRFSYRRACGGADARERTGSYALAPPPRLVLCACRATFADRALRQLGRRHGQYVVRLSVTEPGDAATKQEGGTAWDIPKIS